MKIERPHEWQLRAVEAFDALGGIFCAMPPGAGKSWVAVQCLARAERGLYVMPAALRKQTRDLLALYDVKAEIRSYNEISLDADLLERLHPDVLILDEGQKTKNVVSAACAKRIARYLAANPSCRVVVLSGSIMHRSVLDYAHGLVWALRAGSPAPRSAAAWPRLALDVERDPAAWLERLKACPGVFLDGAPSWAGKLTSTELKLPLLLPDAYARAESGLAPDGWQCESQWTIDELCKQLAWGFYMKRTPRPSPALLDAQRTWMRCVEDAKAHGLADTELGARSVYPQGYGQWQRALEAEPEGAPVVEWLADPPIPEALPGTIVWVHHRALGERLASLTGWPYHREATLDAQGAKLADAAAPVVLASVSACREGVDGAQHKRSHMIWLEPSADARVWQQGIARLARQGQPAAEVTSTVLIAAPVFQRSLDAARKAAYRIETETGQEQLLLQGTTR